MTPNILKTSLQFITSTKFWIIALSMIGVTAVQIYSMYLGIYENIKWYLEWMAGVPIVFVALKTYQNLSFKNGNGKNGINNGS